MHFEDYLKGYEYNHKPPLKEEYNPNLPIITIIIDVFFQLEYVKKSIESILAQTYPNVELMIIDNGSSEDIKEFINQVYTEYKNVNLIKFYKNVFSWHDVALNVVVCWNAALKYAKGNYISHLAYDDMMSENYAERMVQLFVENPECTTAAPVVVTVDEFGKMKGETYKNNLRDRYTVGQEIAFDLIDGNPRKLFSAPGEIFCIRKDQLVKMGGYDRLIDISQVLKYGIFGISGYDSEAKIFWRHHSNQTNKLSKKKGTINYLLNKNSWKESSIQEIWKDKFDEKINNKLTTFIENSLRNSVFFILDENLQNLNFNAVIQSLKEIRNQCPHFSYEAISISIIFLLKLPITLTLMVFRFFKKRIK